MSKIWYIASVSYSTIYWGYLHEVKVRRECGDHLNVNGRWVSKSSHRHCSFSRIEDAEAYLLSYRRSLLQRLAKCMVEINLALTDD